MGLAINNSGSDAQRLCILRGGGHGASAPRQALRGGGGACRRMQATAAGAGLSPKTLPPNPLTPELKLFAVTMPAVGLHKKGCTRHAEP